MEPHKLEPTHAEGWTVVNARVPEDLQLPYLVTFSKGLFQRAAKSFP